MIASEKIGLAAEMACLLEVCAEKPGNVTRQADFDDSCFEEFIVSAVAIGPAFRKAAESQVGEIILGAIQATQQLVSVNTNLGIVLLLAPLAKAASLKHYKSLRTAVAAVLKDLSVDDARLAYEAIRLARPGGMGQVKRFDLSETDVDITLYTAMKLAGDRDTVAKEYVTDFEITFDLGLSTLEQMIGRGVGISPAIVQTFLSILTKVPDTLIARKNGIETAIEVSNQARKVLKQGGIFSEKGQEAIKNFDFSLRSNRHNLNPGTTADLVASVIFVYLVENDLPVIFTRPPGHGR
jgi:triphosphoribosyl-dephospho-CoA synthase